MAIIRAEKPGDLAAIRSVHLAAFPTSAEADLVDALRSSAQLTLSLVADFDGAIVGHIAFSPVTVEGRLGGWGLAPLAVLPEFQRRRFGTALVEAGLAGAGAADTPFVVVLGHPGYYPRFGFRKASTFGLGNAYGADDAFMVAELQPGGVPTGGGLVQYCEAFDPWG